MRTYEIGDTVRCVYPKDYTSQLTMGREYEAVGHNDKYVRVVNDLGHEGGYSRFRFELVEPEKTGKASFAHSPGYQQGVAACEKPTKTSGLQTQIGGSHYTDMVIQPIEYIQANRIPFPEGNVIKYVSRWRSKGGIKDLEKAKHHLSLLIEYETAEFERTKAMRAREGR